MSDDLPVEGTNLSEAVRERDPLPGDQQPIRAAVFRGGTSKGVFLHAADLPGDPAERDRTILAVFGSPDARQIDGLGGADPLTSKVAIIAPSTRPDADVDYTFGYVGISRGFVDYAGNCGNISQAVGPFAVDEGLVAVREPVTRVRIFNTNTKKLMVAEVPVAGLRARTAGDFAIYGVPGTGARIDLEFVDAAGSGTGKLLPTGNVVDELTLGDGRCVRASLVDAANPAVFVLAADVGLSGVELPADCERNPGIVSVMDDVRKAAAVRMGLAPDRGHVSEAVPKIGVVAAPTDYTTSTGETVAAADVDVVARTLALGVMHKAYAVTGGLCLGVAARIEGTVVDAVTRRRKDGTDLVRVGHPGGVSTYAVRVERSVSGFSVRKAAVAGTARRIMDGAVYVPRRL